MGRISFPALAALAALLVFASLPAHASDRCEAASLEEARAMAIRAGALLLEVGPREGFARLANPESGFIDRDLYVFILDLEGRIWFNAVFPVRPGQNILGARDRQGRYFVREMVAVARDRGEGWVEYEWFSPCTGDLEPKSAYVVRVGPLIVAVGAYGSVPL